MVSVLDFSPCSNRRALDWRKGGVAGLRGRAGMTRTTDCRYPFPLQYCNTHHSFAACQIDNHGIHQWPPSRTGCERPFRGTRSVALFHWNSFRMPRSLVAMNRNSMSLSNSRVVVTHAMHLFTVVQLIYDNQLARQEQGDCGVSDLARLTRPCRGRGRCLFGCYRWGGTACAGGGLARPR